VKRMVLLARLRHSFTLTAIPRLSFRAGCIIGMYLFRCGVILFFMFAVHKSLFSILSRIFPTKTAMLETNGMTCR